MMEHLREMWRRTARGGTVLYRGMSIDVPLDALMRDGASAVTDAILRAAQNPPGYGRTGIGVHWTESKGTAENFAWQIGYDNYMVAHYPYEGRRGRFSFELPIVLIGRPLIGSIRMDDKVKDSYVMTDIDQTDPDYGTSVYDAEIPVAQGAEIMLESTLVAMPNPKYLREYADMPEEKRPSYDRVVSHDLRSGWSWVEVRTPLRVKASKAAPDGVQLVHRAHSDEYTDDWFGTWDVLLAMVDGEEVGRITWQAKEFGSPIGMIHGLSVKEGWRRRGIATALYERAKQIEPRLHHSPDRTKDGKAWIHSLGSTAAQFLEASVADISAEFPRLARDGDCIAASEKVTARLVSLGFDATVESIVGWVDQGHSIIGYMHQATAVGESIIDLTATQFDPSLPMPWVAPRSEYLDRLATATGVSVVTVGF